MPKIYYDPQADENEQKDIQEYSTSFWITFFRLAALLIALAVLAGFLG